MPFSPELTVTVRDSNSETIALTGNDKLLVRYFSNAKATMSARAQDGASMNLDTYIIRNGSATGFGEEHTFEGVSSNVFNFSAEDSEGRIGTKTVVSTMVEYIKLTCNAVESRPDANGKIVLTCYGDFYNDGFGKVVNTVNADYQYREKGGTWSSWRTMTVDAVGNKYYASASLTGLDYQKTYEFNFSANDELMWVTTSMSNVKSVPVFHWGENDVTFEVPVTMNKDTNIKGNLRLKGDGNFGNYLRFGDGDYCYLAESADDELTITTKKLHLANYYPYPLEITLDGKLVSFAEKGTWTPTVDDSVVSSYNSRSGWYSKVGNVVTVGFYIKVRCIADELVESADIRIQGLPYTPASAVAGGGMCSGALMTSAKNFQCFVAETGGYISTRVQACDSTSGKFLQTSATGCNYPAGGELTLSGTITYMTN